MKKIIMMLVTMSMILSFVACGNSKETGNSETVATDSSAVSEETIAKELEEFGKEFTCLYDKWDLYKATQLSETTFKIENWGRFDAGDGLFSDNQKQHTILIEPGTYPGYETPTPPKGYVFDKWVDENGNDIPKTIISREYSSEWKPQLR